MHGLVHAADLRMHLFIQLAEQVEVTLSLFKLKSANAAEEVLFQEVHSLEDAVLLLFSQQLHVLVGWHCSYHAIRSAKNMSQTLLSEDDAQLSETLTFLKDVLSIIQGYSQSVEELVVVFNEFDRNASEVL